MAINAPGIAGPYILSFLEAMQRAKAAQGAERGQGIEQGLAAMRLLEGLRQQKEQGEALVGLESAYAGLAGAPSGAPEAPVTAPGAALPTTPPGQSVATQGGLQTPTLAQLGTPRQAVQALRYFPEAVKTIVEAKRERETRDNRLRAQRIYREADAEKDPDKYVGMIVEAAGLAGDNATRAKFLEVGLEMRQKPAEAALAAKEMAAIRAADAAAEADPTPANYQAVQDAIFAGKSVLVSSMRDKLGEKLVNQRFSPDAQEQIAWRTFLMERTKREAQGLPPDDPGIVSKMMAQPQLADGIGRLLLKSYLSGKDMPRAFYDANRIEPPAKGASKTDRDAAYATVKAGRPDLAEGTTAFIAAANEELNRMLAERAGAVSRARITPEAKKQRALTIQKLEREASDEVTRVLNRLHDVAVELDQLDEELLRSGIPPEESRQWQILIRERAHWTEELDKLQAVRRAETEAAKKGQAAPAPSPESAAPSPSAPAPRSQVVPAVPPSAPPAPPAAGATPEETRAVEAVLASRGLTVQQYKALPPEQQARIMGELRARQPRLGTSAPPAAPSPGVAAQRAGGRAQAPTGETVVPPARGQIGTPAPAPPRPALVPTPSPEPTVEETIRRAREASEADFAERDRERATPPKPAPKPLPKGKRPEDIIPPSTKKEREDFRKAWPKGRPAPKAQIPIVITPEEIERYAMYAFGSERGLDAEDKRLRPLWEKQPLSVRHPYIQNAGKALRDYRRQQPREGR